MKFKNCRGVSVNIDSIETLEVDSQSIDRGCFYYIILNGHINIGEEFNTFDQANKALTWLLEELEEENAER